MNIVQRLTALGLRKPLAVKLENLISKWEKASGPEWTVKRLKSLKLELIHRLAGREMVAPWVRRNKDGLPAGPIAEIFRMATESPKGAFRAVNALMVYSLYISERLTETQRAKFYGSMESTDRTGMDMLPWRRYLVGKIQRIRPPEPWCTVPLSEAVWQPGPDGKSHRETDLFISLMGALRSVPLQTMVGTAKAPGPFRGLFNQVIPLGIAPFVGSKIRGMYPTSPVTLSVGKISYIQEPGFKLRAVANPLRVVQAALEPLKKALGEVVKSLPNDYTFDQQAGVSRVQGWIRDRRVCYSVDLSDATNLFPRTYTFAVLRNRLRMQDAKDSDSWKRFLEQVDLFEAVSSSPWFSKESDGPVTHRFTRGQPLGLGPSFFAFAISHHTLLSDIERDCRETDSFVILGDDVVISKPAVYSDYMRRLAQLGCKISFEKSIESSRVAEFAGKIIRKDDVIPQFKWREITDLNALDFLRHTGPAGLALLSPKQRNIVRHLAEIPEHLGGLGWNPSGKSIAERLDSPFGKFILSQKDREVYLPFRRVDAPLIALAHDPRWLELSTCQTVAGLCPSIIPTRELRIPRWGGAKLWLKYHAIATSSVVLPEYVVADKATFLLWGEVVSEDGHIWRALDLYTPSEREDGGDPRVREHVPWFDFVRLFERLQSTLEKSTQ